MDVSQTLSEANVQMTEVACRLLEMQQAAQCTEDLPGYRERRARMTTGVERYPGSFIPPHQLEVMLAHKQIHRCFTASSGTPQTSPPD